MGDYYDEFTSYDLPTHYLDSRKRKHVLNEHGQHLDSCLVDDIKARMAEIRMIDGINTSHLTFSVLGGIASLRGRIDNERSLKFILGAIDSLEGVKGVEHKVQVDGRLPA